MVQRGTPGREWLPVVLATLGSTLLFYSGVFSYLFAVPVQVLFARYSVVRGLIGSALTGAVVLVATLVQVSRVESVMPEVSRLVMLQVLTPLGILAGLALFNAARTIPWWQRLLAAGALATLGALPGLRLLEAAAAGEEPFAAQLQSMLRMAGVVEQPGLIITRVREVVMNVLAIGMTAAIAANWWLGTNLVARRRGGMVSLRRVRLDDRLIWLVIVGLALIVVSWSGATSLAAPVGWNAALVGAFLFGIQGLGLAQHLAWRRGAGPLVERWVLTGVLIALLIPGLNVAIIVALPLFGMSELWINYRRRHDDESDSE